MCNFAGRIMIGFNAIEGEPLACLQTPTPFKKIGEKDVCVSPVYLHIFFVFVVPLTVEKVSSDQQDSCTSRTQFFSSFIGLHSKAVNGMSVIIIFSIK